MHLINQSVALYFTKNKHYRFISLRTIDACIKVVVTSLGVMQMELPISFKSLALFCIRLCCAISIVDVFSVLLHSLTHLFVSKYKYSADTPSRNHDTAKLLQHQGDEENVYSEKLSEVEVKMVMERLGICCHADGGKIHEQVGSEEIARLFDENEASLEEAKEAFNVFDANNDGYIDAKELREVIFGLGFVQVSESVCQRMISTYDDDGDGRVNFSEFVKLLEKNFY